MTALLAWPAETGEFGGPLKAKRVVAITTEQYQTPARRPRNSVLSNAKMQAAFGIVMPDWRSQLGLPCRTRFADNRLVITTLLLDSSLDSPFLCASQRFSGAEMQASSSRLRAARGI